MGREGDGHDCQRVLREEINAPAADGGAAAAVRPWKLEGHARKRVCLLACITCKQGAVKAPQIERLSSWRVACAAPSFVSSCTNTSRW